MPEVLELPELAQDDRPAERDRRRRRVQPELHTKRTGQGELGLEPVPGTTSAASEVRIASGSAMENGMLPVRTQAREYHRRPMQMRRATALGLLVMTVAATACGLPKLEDAQPRVLAQTSFLYAADGSLITELHAGEDRVVLRVRADAAVDQGRDRGDRGPALLVPPRGRRQGAAARRLHQPAVRPDRRGRLHDHPAAREEPLRRRRAHVRTQDRRGGARVAARGAADEGADPRAVPEHGVLRRGGLRRAGGRPPVLQRGGQEPDARPVRDPRRLRSPPPTTSTPPSTTRSPSTGAARCSTRCSRRA